MKRTGFKIQTRKPLKRTAFKKKLHFTKVGELTLISFDKQTSFKTRRKPLKKIGLIGRANLEANKRLKKLFSGVTRCEIGLEGCLVSWPLQACHRHKRLWYKGDVDKLSDYKQVVIGCQNCHQQIEHDKELTESVFLELRGEEK